MRSRGGSVRTSNSKLVGAGGGVEDERVADVFAREKKGGGCTALTLRTGNFIIGNLAP